MPSPQNDAPRVDGDTPDDVKALADQKAVSGAGHKLYACDVMHKRFAPKVHAFKYRVFSLYLNLDDLPSAQAGLLLGINRPGIMSFRDKDHGPGDGTPARDWARGVLARADLGWDESHLHLLCFPRMWGVVFNPLAIYYATNADGGLAGILYQVSNTFGARHSYVLSGDGSAVARHSMDKGFHVSPFMDMDQRYDFSMKAPGEKLSIVIEEFSPAGKTLVATQTGRAVPYGKRQLARMLASHPLMSLKIMTAIHYEALHLWRKGVPFHRSPPVPETPISYGKTPDAASR